MDAHVDVPETCTTPRSEVATAPEAPLPFPLGTILELRWDRVRGVVGARAESSAAGELRLRAVASCPWQRRPLATTAAKVSITVNATAENATWDLLADDSVLRVELTPELVEKGSRSLTNPGEDAVLVLLTASLEPRQASSSSGAWRLQFTMALGSIMIRHVYQAGARLEVPLCDQEGVTAGVASVRLRCGQPMALPPTPAAWDETQFNEHAKRAVQVRVCLAQLRRRDGTRLQKPIEVVVQVAVSGQDSANAFRSRPLKLLDTGADMAGNSETIVLRVDDAWTQAIRFVIFQHNPKERAHQLAEGFASLVSYACDNGHQRKQICVELVDMASSPDIPPRRSLATRGEGDDTPNLWGELSASVIVGTAAPHDEATVDTEQTALSMLMRTGGASGYAAEVCDARGLLEIEVVDVTAIGSDLQGDSEASLRVDLSVAPGSWTKQTTVSWVPRDPHARVAFDCGTYTVPIHWTKKERVIPSVGCQLTLTQQQGLEQETRGMSSTPSNRPSKMKSRDQTATKSQTRLHGAFSIHLPILFKYPSEWLSVEVPVELEGVCGAETIARLRCRICFNANDRQAELTPTSKSLPYYGAGRLSVSNIQCSGPIYKDSQQHVVFAITMDCTGSSTSTARSVSRSPPASERCATWDDPLDCELPPSSCVPIVVFRLFKIDPTLTDVDVASEEYVGFLSMPLPLIVLREQHLVSFTLPLAAPARAPSHELASRKCATLSFDMQFLNISRAQQKRDERKATTALVLQRLKWIQTPAALALAVAKRKFVVVCELSVMAGKSLNQVLWQHTTPLLDVTIVSMPSVDGGEVNHSVAITHPVARKLSNIQSKSILILRFSTKGQQGDPPSTALGQAVIPIRDGWAAFAEQEKDKWHKIYTLGSQKSGTHPEAVGEVQLSVVEIEATTAINLNSAREIDGWLHVEVLEVVADADLVAQSSGARKVEAYIELHQAKSAKPLMSKPRWGTDGLWLWDTDAMFVIPCDTSQSENDRFSVTLVLNSDQRIVIARDIESLPLLEATRSAAASGRGDSFSEEWLVDPNRSVQLRLRLRYTPAVTGVLQVELLQLQPHRHSSARDGIGVRITQLTLRCASTTDPSKVVVSPAIEVPSVGTDQRNHWQRLAGTRLSIKINTTSALRAAIPSVQAQIVGSSVAIQEVCLAEASIPISSALLSGVAIPQWISLHARHDDSQRLAIASVRLQFNPDTPTGNGGLVLNGVASIFPTHEDWRRSGASALTLWKCLFYRLDADRNGRIDITEFKNLFLEHAEVFRETPDGVLLLRVLLYPEEPTHNLRLSPQTAENLFADMDRDHDESVVWTEYVDFFQAKLLSLEPQRTMKRATTTSLDELRPAETTPKQDGSNARELRTKRREDRVDRALTQYADMDGVQTPQRRPSVRQLRAGVGREEIPPPGGDNPRHVSRGGDPELITKLQTAEALLELERQKTTRLQEELRSLRLTHHQLQLVQERHALEKQTQERFIEEAIQTHEAIQRERAATRSRHHTASIVLQSKVRARLEQKKFQALKLQRWNAAVRLQCAFRSCVARRRFAVLQEAERARRRRLQAASTLQRFVRFHLRRKERALLRMARHVSATLLQKYVRRMLAMRRRKRQLDAALTLQCWHRCTSAKRQLKRLRVSVVRLRHWITGKIWERRWRATRRCVCQVQRWWRRSNELRWEYLTKLEAATCIQAVWRGYQHRQKWKLLEARVLEADEYLTQVEAATCVQAVWRGYQHRLKWRLLEAGVLDAESKEDKSGEQCLTQVEAATCVQAVWRGHQQRLKWRLLEDHNLQADHAKNRDEVNWTVSARDLTQEVNKEHFGDETEINKGARANHDFSRVQGDHAVEIQSEEISTLLQTRLDGSDRVNETDDDRQFAIDSLDEGDQILPPTESFELAPSNDEVDSNVDIAQETNMVILATEDQGDSCMHSTGDYASQALMAMSVQRHEIDYSTPDVGENAPTHDVMRVVANNQNTLGEGEKEPSEGHAQVPVGSLSSPLDDSRGTNEQKGGAPSVEGHVVLERAADRDIVEPTVEKPSQVISVIAGGGISEKPVSSISEGNPLPTDQVSNLAGLHEIRALLTEMVALASNTDDGANEEGGQSRRTSRPESTRLLQKAEPSATIPTLIKASDSALYEQEVAEIKSLDGPAAIAAERNRESGTPHTSTDQQNHGLTLGDDSFPSAPIDQDDTIPVLDKPMVDLAALNEPRDLSDFSEPRTDIVEDRLMAMRSENEFSQSVGINHAEAANEDLNTCAHEQVVAAHDDTTADKEAGEETQPHAIDPIAVLSNDKRIDAQNADDDVPMNSDNEDHAPSSGPPVLVEELHGDELYHQDSTVEGERDHRDAPSDQGAPDSSVHTTRSLVESLSQDALDSDEALPHTADEIPAAIQDRMSTPASDDSDSDSLRDSAESDDLMLLDAAAVTQFQQDDQLSDNDQATAIEKPTTIAPAAKRADSDKELLLDLEELTVKTTAQDVDTNPNRTEEQVVVADLD